MCKGYCTYWECPCNRIVEEVRVSDLMDNECIESIEEYAFDDGDSIDNQSILNLNCIGCSEREDND